MLRTIAPGLFGICFCFFPFNHKDVVPKNRGNDRNHVSLNYTRAYILGASNADVDDALKGKIPFPHMHFIFASALFQDAHKAFNTSIHGQNVSYAGG